MKFQSTDTTGVEKQRAANIIWNACDNYSIQPEFQAYDENGKADLYWNFIIGAVHKYFDYTQLQNFFNNLKEDRNYAFYEALTWIGLENCVFQKGKNERLVLDDLRRSFSQKVLTKVTPASDYDILNEIRLAYFQRVLGVEPDRSELVFNIINDLDFDQSTNTEQFILKMNEIINVYFQFKNDHYKRNWLWNIWKNKNNLHFSENSINRGSGSFLQRFTLESANNSKIINFEEKNGKQNKNFSRWSIFAKRRENRQREYIQSFYGVSILPELQTKALEQTLCIGNHKNLHLHFTRGIFENKASKNSAIANHKKVVTTQVEKNKEYFKKNYVRNSISISKLTNKIKNSISVNFESSFKMAKVGKLVSGKIWRNIFLYDNKILKKDLKDDFGNIAVNIVLDASGSQINRQEIIATQGYIIAESLTRCQIPVRVCSFCTNSSYTIINLYRDYGEVNQNDKIFNYHATGCNRDGLAIRAIAYLMKISSYEHKILIILSDGKPNDPKGILSERFNPVQLDYADTIGVNDTALEVRKGWQNGISILCVFTGLDDDFPAAKKIYGRNMVRIKSPENFADIVGVLILNEVNNI